MWLAQEAEDAAEAAVEGADLAVAAEGAAAAADAATLGARPSAPHLTTEAHENEKGEGTHDRMFFLPKSERGGVRLPLARGAQMSKVQKILCQPIVSSCVGLVFGR